MSLTEVSQNKCFGGMQFVYEHASTETGTPMRFGVFLPPQANNKKVPALYWLSGLTCTEENFIVKAGVQRIAAELGVAIIAPDTSPRGLGYEGEDDSYDFGTGAGFYLDATEAPWSTGYRMYSYVSQELPALINENFPVDASKAGIFGHSMGGHGALTIGIKNPSRFKTISAFAPICAPSQVPWGEKVFTNYLGSDRANWSAYDATDLINTMGWHGAPLLIDQGTSDQFLAEQLKPEIFQAACKKAKVPLELRMQDGYDHSYFFMATFMEDHVRFHVGHLT
ncbi:MAG: S-formylglutathione hydrolase [Burkholderiaceae bacterium]